MKVNNGYFVQNLKTVDERVLNNLFRLSAKLYNQALYFINYYNDTYERYPTWNIVCDELKHTKNYKLLGNMMSTSIIRNLDINFKNYFKNKKGEGNLRRPNWRQKDFFIAFFGNMVNFKNNGSLSLYLGQDFQKKYNCKSFLDIPIPKNFKYSGSTTQIRLQEKQGKYMIVYTYKPESEKLINKGTKMSIDLGMNQLFAMYMYNEKKDIKPVLISGRKIKNINHHMLKRMSNDGVDNDKINLKRERQIEQEINRYINYIFKVARHNGVNEIAVGFFKDIKENKVARHFFYIPHSKIRRKIRDMGLKFGIKTIFDDESYTSKTSFLDLELPEKQSRYKGKRVKRGLFRTESGIELNSDINGAAQIMVKLIDIKIKNRDNVLLHPIVIKR